MFSFKITQDPFTTFLSLINFILSFKNKKIITIINHRKIRKSPKDIYEASMEKYIQFGAGFSKILRFIKKALLLYKLLATLPQE